MKKKTKAILFGISFCLLLIILAFSFRVAILNQSGRFMAPQGDYVADIAILEGSEFVRPGVITRGLHLVSSGKVKQIIVVLYRIAPSYRPFGLSGDYPNLVKKEIGALGLKERDFQVVTVHIDHPVTLTAAKGTMEAIAKKDVKSAILLSPGFHARRSYLVYQYVSEPFHIKILPCASFDSYELERWWCQNEGMRDFIQELSKLIYYFVRGYIPLRFSY